MNKVKEYYYVQGTCKQFRKKKNFGFSVYATSEENAKEEAKERMKNNGLTDVEFSKVTQGDYASQQK